MASGVQLALVFPVLVCSVSRLWKDGEERQRLTTVTSAECRLISDKGSKMKLQFPRGGHGDGVVEE